MSDVDQVSDVKQVPGSDWLCRTFSLIPFKFGSPSSMIVTMVTMVAVLPRGSEINKYVTTSGDTPRNKG